MPGLLHLRMGVPKRIIFSNGENAFTHVRPIRIIVPLYAGLSGFSILLWTGRGR